MQNALYRTPDVFSYYRRLRKVESYVNRHISNSISLSHAAQVVNLEEKYFSSWFHKVTGICFSQWIAQKRVEKSIELIKLHNANVTEVALAVGFRSLRTFERAFKKYTGVTPREYKRSVRRASKEQSCRSLTVSHEN